jgi:fatty-acyl-CoA synthase
MTKQSTAPPSSTLGEALREQARLRPDQPALIFPQTGHHYSFSQWLNEASRIACGLVELGAKPGNHIALLAQNRIEWPVVEMAVALCGAVLVPLNTHFARDDLLFALRESNSKMIFLSSEFRSHHYLDMLREFRNELENLTHVINFDGPEADCLSFSELEQTDLDFPTVRSNDTAGLLYTSGTTGFPKGALLSHSAMLFDSWQTARRLAIHESDRWTSIIPLFHCSGCIMNVLGLLQNGACYVGVDAFDPVTMFEVIEAQACTGLSGVPTSFLAMLEHPERSLFDLSSLRAGTCGGATVSADMLKECAAKYPIPKLVNVYGQTESATIIACPALDDEDRFQTAGAVLDGAELRITDTVTGIELGLGQIGQVEARGPMVMTGYFDQVEASAEALSVDGWLRTGDLGFVTERGKLCLSGGRLRDMIIRGGENIYPVEIENWLLHHPAVQQVAVFAMPDRYYGEAVAAVVILAAPVTAPELETHCHGHLARFKIPITWYQTTEFPLTASGKVRKVVLREYATENALTALM